MNITMENFNTKDVREILYHKTTQAVLLLDVIVELVGEQEQELKNTMPEKEFKHLVTHLNEWNDDCRTLSDVDSVEGLIDKHLEMISGWMCGFAYFLTEDVLEKMDIHSKYQYRIAALLNVGNSLVGEIKECMQVAVDNEKDCEMGEIH
jgi:hypothetical protein